MTAATEPSDDVNDDDIDVDDVRSLEEEQPRDQRASELYLYLTRQVGLPAGEEGGDDGHDSVEHGRLLS